jgi:1-acyl-sn-glycerol-3-phosphate acyltransferase
LQRLGVRTVVAGAPAAPSRSAVGRLVVANHLGFLDILVFAAWRPFVFVAKPEVSRWPLIGPYATRRDTVFIPRQPSRALPLRVTAIAEALIDGRDVLVFPEATTSRGATVLPFRPACFEAARRAHADIECVHLDYRVADGRDPTALTTWVDDDWLLPRAIAIACGPPISAIVERLVVIPSDAFADRKAAARHAHAIVAGARARACAARTRRATGVRVATRYSATTPS